MTRSYEITPRPVEFGVAVRSGAKHPDWKFGLRKRPHQPSSTPGVRVTEGFQNEHPTVGGVALLPCRLLGLLVSAILLCGCGDSGGSTSNSPPTVSISQASAISGVAALGAPLGGTLYLEDANGTIKQTLVSASDGRYGVDVTGLAAPYFLKFVDNSGFINLYSVAVKPGVANLNPLSGQILTQAARSIYKLTANPSQVFAAPAKFASLSSNDIDVAAQTIVNGLSEPIRQKLLISSLLYTNPISDPYIVGGGGFYRVFAESDVELDRAKTFMYQIQQIDRPGAVAELAASNYPMLVVEPNRTNRGQESFNTVGMVRQLKTRGNGGPRLVIAYIDIGEAESYRSYWGADWVAATDTKRGRPDFIVSKDPDGWSSNFPVAYWDGRWKALWLGDDGLVAQMAKAGFDGVYLDWGEGYLDPKIAAAAAAAGVDPATEMITFVEQIRAAGRKVRPDFKVIAQNALYLIDKNPERYLKAIDAIGVEDTWFHGVADTPWGNPKGGDIPNTAVDEFSTNNKIAQFQKFLRAGKPAFTIDYALKPGDVTAVYQAAAKAGVRALVSQIELSHLTTTPPPGLAAR